MITYKFLAGGAVGPFSGFRWPTPSAGAPGAWVEAAGTPPSHGIHGCGVEDLPYWVDEELWVAELDGEIVRTEHQVVASRGRLVARVDAWRDLAREFAADCAGSLRARVDAALAAGDVAGDAVEPLRGYRDDAAACAAAGGSVAAAAYVAARASAVLDGDRRGFTAERQRQARWLELRLGAHGSVPARR